MLNKNKELSAFRSLQLLAIKGRTYSYNKVPYEQIADLMDRMEYLASLAYTPDELTGEFQAYLEETAEKHQCWGAVDAFT